MRVAVAVGAGVGVVVLALRDTSPVGHFTSAAAKDQWLHEVLLQLPEPHVHLVGLSIGGWTTANLLINQPSKVSCAVLLDPVYVFSDMSLEAIVRSIPASVRWFPKAWRDSFASWTAGGAPSRTYRSRT
jgi:pimeloyl-ACP methyl ester carboxylesterase